jgi:hypothetical protein
MPTLTRWHGTARTDGGRLRFHDHARVCERVAEVAHGELWESRRADAVVGD